MIFLRKAEAEDVDLLFRWANDPIVRSNSFNSSVISYENHVKWFNRAMEDSAVIMYVLMDDDSPVGQIRLNVENDKAEISYSIQSELRGKGYGRKILQLIANEVSIQHPRIKTLVARVKPNNIVSKTLFESEGYEMKYLCYMLNVQMGGGTVEAF